MSTRALIYFGLSIICAVLALIIFFTKFYNWQALVFLALGAATVLLFRQGFAENKKKQG
jgi:membrane protein implicated in regulation of membrane protease activity